MAVFRVERNSGYTVMSNHHLRNKELTLKAKGLLSQMLSLPEDWDYTLGDLITVWNIIINNPLEKFTGTFAGDVFHYRIQLDIGTFQNFLQTVYFPAAFFRQAFAVTGDLTQFTLLPVRNIAGFQQAMPCLLYTSDAADD